MPLVNRALWYDPGNIMDDLGPPEWLRGPPTGGLSGPALKPAPESEISLTPPNFIRAEANFLRFPLFALHTKGLRNLDGIECKGAITRNGQRQTFVLRATRNAASYYPGPLARAAHLAFLSIATERGFPLQNPIIWTWRDLCRRMQIANSGTIVRKLKVAIKSTARLSIETQQALYSKPDASAICTNEQELHLYDQVEFRGGKLEDGTVSDQNRLWFSDWFLTNLNALFTAPLDYTLWLSLNEHSTIASRLYEILTLYFYRTSPVRINYATLAQFLPVAPERYQSQAIQQLDPAFQLLMKAGVINNVNWTTGKNEQAQIHLYRGTRLTPIPQPDQSMLPFLEDDFAANVAVHELRNLESLEATLVKDFYRLWVHNENSRPTKQEIAQAAEITAQHGPIKAKALIPLIVAQMKEKWPGAKSFGAVLKYLPEAVQDYERKQRQAERHKQMEAQERQDHQKAAREAKDRAALNAIWETLPKEEQDNIRQTVLASKHPSLKLQKHPALLEGFCLSELGRQRGLLGS